MLVFRIICEIFLHTIEVLFKLNVDRRTLSGVYCLFYSSFIFRTLRFFTNCLLERSAAVCWTKTRDYWITCIKVYFLNKQKSYLGIVDVDKRNADITRVIFSAQDVKDTNIEHHKSSESVINDFYFQGCQATWNKIYYSSLLSEP